MNGDTDRVTDDERGTPRGFQHGDTIPYVVPDSLDDLQGPTSGVVELPQAIDPLTGTRYNLDNLDEQVSMYSRVISEASRTDELARYLNRDVLVQLWPSLTLSRFCVRKWNARFSELAAVRPDTGPG